MSPEDNGRLGHVEKKLDTLLDIAYGTRADAAAAAVRINHLDKGTLVQTDRLNEHDRRLRKTETSLGRIWGGLAVITATGLGGLGALAAWVKNIFDGGSS
ncbi:MAG: hypothetical protein V3W19_01900 [Desulfatiglandales bacterium]